MSTNAENRGVAPLRARMARKAPPHRPEEGPAALAALAEAVAAGHWWLVSQHADTLRALAEEGVAIPRARLAGEEEWAVVLTYPDGKRSVNVDRVYDRATARELYANMRPFALANRCLLELVCRPAGDWERVDCRDNRPVTPPPPREVEPFADEIAAMLDLPETPCDVILDCDKTMVREDTVELADISEDLYGRDVLTFTCPKCRQTHKSLRIG